MLCFRWGGSVTALCGDRGVELESCGKCAELFGGGGSNDLLKELGKFGCSLGKQVRCFWKHIGIGMMMVVELN